MYRHAGGALEVRSVAGALLNSRKLCRGLLLRLVWQKQYFGNVFTKVTVTARRLHQRSETAAAFDVPHGVRKFVFQETRNDLTAADFDRDNDPLHAVNAAFADLVSAKLRRWLKAPGSVAMLCLTASGGLRCGDIGQLFNAAPRLAAPAAALDSAPLASAPLASAPSPAEGLPPQTTMKPPNPSTTRKRPANIADAAAPQAKGARSAHATAQRPADRAAAKAKAPRTWAEPATSSEPPRTSPLSDAEWHCSLCTYRHAGAQSAFLACAVCRAPKQ
ncbi:hypothetical protein M885DRAFT_142674 [Pelagophyceae sp. CCMP2097]|nr:hypothetical protein M885DRAFT_142674 [Pelagophyceae sp. CCMP2097]